MIISQLMCGDVNYSQGAGVFFGKCRQEDIGKVDEKSTDGLLGRVKKPEEGKFTF